MKQSIAFLEGEGAAWLKRNQGKFNPAKDPVLQAIEKYKIEPKRVLEVGCADGARLKVLEKSGCWIRGVDPGCDKNDYRISQATASHLPLIDGCMDTVIYGWCLYLCDPEDYFKIAREGDRVLASGGYLIVYDFHADYPYKTPYKHKNGLFSYHYDFSKLWLSHPAYSLYGREIHSETSVTILHKDTKNAFPVEK